MDPIHSLLEEHEEIERELIELKTILSDSPINYPNLLHILNKLINYWNSHEIKEEKIFSVLKDEGIKIPVSKIEFEHRFLKKHREKITEAIYSGSEIKTRGALEKHGRINNRCKAERNRIWNSLCSV